MIKVHMKVRVSTPGAVWDGMTGRVVATSMHNVHRQAGDEMWWIVALDPHVPGDQSRPLVFRESQLREATDA